MVHGTLPKVDLVGVQQNFVTGEKPSTRDRLADVLEKLLERLS